MSSPEEVVSAFMAEFANPHPDVDVLLGYFAVDAVYHNMPSQPAVGHEAIRQTLSGFVTRMELAGWEVLNQLSSGDLVMNERIDRFLLPGKAIALPVAGVFRVRDGKISAWRDYFDMATWQKQMAG